MDFFFERRLFSIESDGIIKVTLTDRDWNDFVGYWDWIKVFLYSQASLIFTLCLDLYFNEYRAYLRDQLVQSEANFKGKMHSAMLFMTQ